MSVIRPSSSVALKDDIKPSRKNNCSKLLCIIHPKKLGISGSNAEPCLTTSSKIFPLNYFHNKYLRLFIFVLTCILTSVVYIGWTPLTVMLIRSGVYSSHCLPGEIVTDVDKGCAAQQNKFNQIYYTGLASEAIIGALAGICFDSAGAFFTGFLGEIMFGLGWLCFAFSNADRDFLYPGIVLLAGAGNMIGFPTLILTELFPKVSIWITSVVVAAQSTSSIIPTILLWIMNANPRLNHKTVFVYYFFLAYIPCSCLFLLSLPLRRKRVKCHPYDCDTESDESDSRTDLHIRKKAELKLEECYLDVGISPSQLENPALFIQLSSLEYLIFSLFYVLQQLQCAYFPNFVRDDIGSSYSLFLASVLPIQGIIGPLIGIVAEKITILPIACMLSLLMTGVYCIALLFGKRSVYFLMIFYVLANSFIFTTRFNYLAETFCPSHYGALVGIMGAVSGVITLGVGFIPRPDYVTGCIIYLVCGIIALICVVFLIERKKHHHSTKNYFLEFNNNLETTEQSQPRV